jgi:membrane protein
MSRSAEALDVVKRVVGAAREHDVEYPAASLAYYGFVSLFPLLVLLLTVLSRPVVTAIQSATPPFLTPSTQQLVYEATTGGDGRGAAAALAVVVLVWSGANVTVDVRTTVKRAEGGIERSPRDVVRDAVCVLGSLVLAVVAILVTSVFFATFSDVPLLAAVAFAALLSTLTAAFLPLYYVPSRLVTSWREALPGAVAAAVGWTALLGVAHFYAVNAEQYAVYGVISGIIIIISGLYVAALVLLLGFLLNATLAAEHRRQTDHAADG